MREFNEDHTRLISDEDAALAIVGYIGEARDGLTFEGRHAGCFEDLERAQAWLRGEPVTPDFRFEYTVLSWPDPAYRVNRHGVAEPWTP